MNKTNINNTDNTDNESGTWFWNESANKMDLNIEKKGNSNHENDLEGDKIT